MAAGACMLLQTIYWYKQYTGTNNILVQTIRWYKQYAGTNNTLAQTIRWYKKPITSQPNATSFFLGFVRSSSIDRVSRFVCAAYLAGSSSTRDSCKKCKKLINVISTVKSTQVGSSQNK